MHSLCTKIGILPERQCKDTTRAMQKYPHGSASFRMVPKSSAFVFIVHRRGIPCGCPMMCVLRFIRVPTRGTPTVIIICHPLHGGVRGGFFLSFFSFYYARTYNSIFAGSSIWELRGFCKGSASVRFGISQNRTRPTESTSNNP